MNVEYKELKKEGFIEAGKNTGNPSALNQHLNSIKNGQILDVSAPLNEENQEVLRSKIEKLNQMLREKQNNLASTRETLSGIQSKISEARRLYDDFIAGRLTSRQLSYTAEPFSYPKFIFSFFFLAMLSVWLFLFYTVTIFRALFQSPGTVAQYLINYGSLPVLPTFNDLYVAIMYNPPIIFAPFVFYAFGYAIHVILDGNLKKLSKVIYILLIILVTFVLDFLIALKIHDLENQARNITGSGMIPWYDNGTIYIILSMGFVTFLIWAILFHNFIKESEKENPARSIRRQIANWQKEEEQLRKDVDRMQSEVSSCISDIESKQAELIGKVFPVRLVKRSISEFVSGWYNFINAIPRDSALNNALISECDKVVDRINSEFKDEE